MLTREQEKKLGYPEKVITKRPDGSIRVTTVHLGESLTDQQYKDECDVNNIIKKYLQTGSVTHVRNAQQGVYADLTELPSYHEAMGVVAKANEAFQEIPAAIRNRFNHNPQELIDFLADKKNNDEAIKLGLKTPPKPVTTDPVLETLKEIKLNTQPKQKTKQPTQTEQE